MRLATCTLATTLCAVCALPGGEQRPNIVLLMTDDQGHADIGVNRALHPSGAQLHTPELDRMASQSLWFNRAYAAAPVCSPTRGSVLTGRHPFRYGVVHAGSRLPTQERTLAQDLAEAGYATGHFGKWHLDGRSGPGKPLEPNDPHGPAKFGFQAWFSVSNYFELDTTFGSPTGPQATTGDGSATIVTQANGFIATSVAARKPFFAVVWFGSPHSPHQPVAADLEQCGGNAKFGEILGIDRAVGRLRGELTRLGVADNTVVWFTSDNGSQDEGGNGPLRGKKAGIFEGGVRVPGMLCWPKQEKPGRSDIPVVTSDIRPTVLALTGVKPAHMVEPLDGIDLSPLLRGKMQTRPQPICFWSGGKPAAPDQGHAVILDNTWKLHRLGEAWTLYDLAADPRETNDVAAANGPIVARLRPQLEAWQASVAASCDGKDYPEGLGGGKKGKAK